MKTWDEILNVSLTNNVTLGKEPHLYKPVFSYLQRRIALLPISCPDQSILKEINPEYSLEGLMLNLKLQYFGYLMWRANSLEKTLMLGKTEGKRKRQRQRMTWLDGSWLNRHESEQMAHDSINMNLSQLWEIVGDKGAWCEVVLGLRRVGHDIVTEQQQNALSILHLCIKS